MGVYVCVGVCMYVRANGELSDPTETAKATNSIGNGDGDGNCDDCDDGAVESTTASSDCNDSSQRLTDR